MTQDTLTNARRSQARSRTLILTCISLLFAVALLLTFDLLASYQTIRRMAEQDLRLVRAEAEIIRLDQLLPLSVQAAAASGDTAYLRSYAHHLGELDSALQVALALALVAVQQAVQAKTFEANEALVTLETSAMDLVRAGRPQQAMAVLRSPAYQTQKQRYA